MRINPVFANAWINKGDTLTKLEKYDEALECYYWNKKASLSSIDKSFFWLERATRLFGIKHDEKIKLYGEVIRINPENDDAWRFKGLALSCLGKYEEAIKCYDEAIRIKPEDGDTWSHKGSALNKLGKYDEATLCFNKIKTLNK